jgi:metal-responsive CopG/Arc/MetJ family transcriptional regulator
MKKSKVTITLSEELLDDVDKLVRRQQAEQVKAGQLVTANRSQMMEALVHQGLRRK